MHVNLISAADLIVASDYSQFTLETSATGVEFATELLSEASEAGIAQRDGLVLVWSPHQNNYDMKFRVEVWSGEPADDLDDWQEAFELPLCVGESGLTYGSPTMEDVGLPVLPGSYRALLTGRGFVARGWPGSTTPGDVWRLRLWPSVESFPATRLRAYSEEAVVRGSLGVTPTAATSAVDEDGASAAAARIRADLRGLGSARKLAGATGTVEIKDCFDTTPGKLFKALGRLDFWLGSGGAGSSPGENANGGVDGFRSEGSILCCVNGGNIVGDFIDFERPGHFTCTWIWNVRRSSRPSQAASLVPFLPAPTILHITLLERADRGTAQTCITLRHSQLPTEWLDDLRSFWIWTLGELPRRVRF